MFYIHGERAVERVGGVDVKSPTSKHTNRRSSLLCAAARIDLTGGSRMYLLVNLILNYTVLYTQFCTYHHFLVIVDLFATTLTMVYSSTDNGKIHQEIGYDTMKNLTVGDGSCFANFRFFSLIKAGERDVRSCKQ